jgi:hypothetical protein
MIWHTYLINLSGKGEAGAKLLGQDQRMLASMIRRQETSALLLETD